MKAETVAARVRVALRECGHRSLDAREGHAFLALAETITDAGARKIWAMIR